MKKIIISLVAAAFISGCSGASNEGKAPANEPDNTQTATENAETADGTQEAEVPPVSENVVTDENFDQFAPPEQGETVAVFKTNLGDIKVKFFAEDAPKAVENFTTHAKNGYYNNLTFCRVIDGFMIQGGSPTNDGRGGESIWKEPFEDEFSPRLHNYRGALSMANAGLDTNGSQFFIVQAGPVNEYVAGMLTEVSEYTEAMYQDNRTLEIISGAQRFTGKAVDTYKKVGGVPTLDGGFPVSPEDRSWHTVFGQVYEGMEIVDAIAAAETDENDRPVEPVVISSIEVMEFN